MQRGWWSGRWCSPFGPWRQLWWIRPFVCWSWSEPIFFSWRFRCFAGAPWDLVLGTDLGGAERSGSLLLSALAVAFCSANSSSCLSFSMALFANFGRRFLPGFKRWLWRWWRWRVGFRISLCRKSLDLNLWSWWHSNSLTLFDFTFQRRSTKAWRPVRFRRGSTLLACPPHWGWYWKLPRGWRWSRCYCPRPKLDARFLGWRWLRAPDSILKGWCFHSSLERLVSLTRWLPRFGWWNLERGTSLEVGGGEWL